MLPPDTKLNKVAPPGWLSSGKSKGLLGLPTSFMLYLRLRFFLPSLRGIRYARERDECHRQLRPTDRLHSLHCFQELDIEAPAVSADKAMHTGAAAGLPVSRINQSDGPRASGRIRQLQRQRELTRVSYDERATLAMKLCDTSRNGETFEE